MKYSLDGLEKSMYQTGAIRKRKDYEKIFGKGLFKEMKVSEWDTVYENIEMYVVETQEPSTFCKVFKREHIAFEFAKIKTVHDIEIFAEKYGLLGIGELKQIEAQYFKSEKYVPMLPLNGYILPIEPINLWFDIVDHVQKLVKLYRALINHKEIEEELLTIEQIHEDYSILWATNHKITALTLSKEEIESLSYETIGKRVLIAEILPIIDSGRIKITPIVNDSEKTPLKISILEAKYCSQLIIAIYYDLWKLLSKEVAINSCQNQHCQMPFIKRGKAKYCSTACKQEAYRIRKAINRT